MALARFLTLEPESGRSSAMATQLWEILFAGVEAQNITISTSENKEGDPAAAQALAIPLVAASRYSDEWKDKSDAQFFAHAFGSVLAILSELDEKETSKDPFWSALAIPYFRDARQAGHIEAMAYAVRRSLGDPETTQWIKDHSEAVDRFNQWSKDWKVPHQ